jgi:Universal stress protein family
MRSRSRGNTTLGLPSPMWSKTMPDGFSQKCPASNGRNLRRETPLGRESTELPQVPTEIGTESDLILRVADEAVADLIVLTVPAAHRFTNRFLSTNSYRVVCGAACPVLTVRAKELDQSLTQ